MKRVLIVEDDEYLRRASEIALRRAGYVVLAAAGGVDGLRLAKTAQPDLIVLDLLMPRPTGLDVLRALRAEEETRAIPVLVVSNSSMQRIVDEVHTLGAEYITKADLSLHDLIGIVEQRLAEPATAAPAPAPPPSPPPAPVLPEPPVVVADAEPRAAEPAPAVPQAAAAALSEEGPTDCAGCGFSVRPGFAFCPRCGRQLDSARSASARYRGVR